MKLYYFETPNPRKACAVARYLNLPVDFVYVDLGKDEHKTSQYLAINPNGKVPALEDGDTRLWEANAIMCHLARKAGSDLWPKEAEQQIEVVKWLSWDSEHFTRHAGNLYFQHVIKRQFGIGEPDQAEADEATGHFRRFAAVLNNQLADRTYILGDRLSVADFAVSATLPYADTIRLPLADYPNIQRWISRLEELPAWREPFPVRKAQAA